MTKEPIQTFLSILVIAIVIILPSGLLVALNNAEQFSGNLESSRKSLYLSTSQQMRQ
jgi:cell division protein FtsX